MHGHVTDALATLHWLRLPERVDFKMAVMAYRVLLGFAPSYPSQLIRITDLPGRRRLRSFTHRLPIHSMFRHFVVLLLVGARFLLQHPSSGTLCHWTFSHQPL